jgi:hypothetical protein
MAARELPPRSFKAFNAALIISAYFGCADACDDFPLVVLVCFFFGDALALPVFGADDVTGAVVLSVIFDVKF